MKNGGEGLPMIRFVYDKKRIRREVDEMKDSAGSTKEPDVLWYFPFSEEDLGSEEKMLEQIDRDEHSCNAHAVFSKVEDEWKKREKRILSKLQRCDTGSFQWQSSYQVIATLYGPTGYFYYPSQVCVRLFDVDQETVLETIVHELIHLLLEHKIEHAPYEEREKMIDGIVIRSGLLAEFSQYHIQKFEG
jgi:hypothetical protein